MGTHVNTAGGFIEDQELRFRQQPAGEQYLLLITAGEKFDRLFGAGGTNTQLTNKTFGNLILFAPPNRPQPAALRL